VAVLVSSVGRVASVRDNVRVIKPGYRLQAGEGSLGAQRDTSTIVSKILGIVYLRNQAAIQLFTGHCTRGTDKRNLM